jgi:hypothetical protein
MLSIYRVFIFNGSKSKEETEDQLPEEQSDSFLKLTGESYKRRSFEISGNC